MSRNRLTNSTTAIKVEAVDILTGLKMISLSAADGITKQHFRYLGVDLWWESFKQQHQKELLKSMRKKTWTTNKIQNSLLACAYRYQQSCDKSDALLMWDWKEWLTASISIC